MLQLQYVQDRHMCYNHFICPFLPHLSLQTVVCVGEKKKKHNLYNHPNIKAGDTSAGDFSPSAE